VQDLGPLVDKWFPSRGEVPGSSSSRTGTPDELPPPPAGTEAPNFSLQPVSHDPFDTQLYLAAERAKQAIERQAAAPLQMGSPTSPDPFMEHEIGQPAWPYAQSPQDMDLQRALATAGGGPEFPAMAPQPPAPVLPTWMDPQKQEASIGPQPADWQKGLEQTLRSIAPQGSGLSDTASAIPSLVGLTPAGAAADVGQSWNRGDLAGAGLAALGALPGVKGAGKVARAGEEAAAGLARRLEANALPKAGLGLTESLGPGTAVPRLTIPAAAPLPGAAESLTSDLTKFAPKGDAESLSLDPQLISTRVPTNKIDGVPNPIAHTTPDLIVGQESSRASEGLGAKSDAYAKNADMLRREVQEAPGKMRVMLDQLAAGVKKLNPKTDVPRYVGLNFGGLRNAHAVSERFINHIRDNVLALHDAIPREIREVSKRWYDGANRIAHSWAEEFGTQASNVAGTIAALSPQTDWFQNVSRARRLLAIDRDQAGRVMTPEMRAWIGKYAAKERAAGKAEAADDLETVLRERGDTKLKDISDPYERAVWSRAFDEVHNPKHYPILHPEGHELGPALTNAGVPEKIGWGSFAEMANAIRAMKATSLEDISRAMGSQHKVRNFYNNIIAPLAKRGDVTVDTHAIAAGLLRPLASSHLEVEHGLGGSGSAHAASGSLGLYGLFAEGYRRAAELRGVLPREMQSMTWEALRGLFTDVDKRDKRLEAAINAIWANHGRPGQDLSETLRLISDRAGGVEVPSWFRPGPGSDVGAWNTADPKGLPRYGLGQRSPGGAGGRARNVNPALPAGPARELNVNEQRRIANEVLQMRNEPR
jgi:hypothetical protein